MMIIFVRFEDVKSSTERELFEHSAARKIRVLHRFLIYDRVATSWHTEFDVYGIYHFVNRFWGGEQPDENSYHKSIALFILNLTLKYIYIFVMYRNGYFGPETFSFRCIFHKFERILINFFSIRTLNCIES